MPDELEIPGTARNRPADGQGYKPQTVTMCAYFIWEKPYDDRLQLLVKDIVMEERTFFEYEDVKVTNARFVSGGQTFAMNNVTSVKPFEKKPNRMGGVIVFCIGLIIMASSSFMMGLLTSIAAGYYLYQQKTVYNILLATSAGETKALATHQKEYLNSVISALNDAIVHRG